MKYVMFAIKSSWGTRHVPILFPDVLSHVDVALGVQATCSELAKAKPISAGFVNSMDVDVATTGKSTTLGLESRVEDAAIIKMYDYMHGL